MTCFSLWLIGTSQPLTVELAVSNIDDLGDALGQSRFLQGELVTDDGELIRALVPTSRIQMLSESRIAD